MRHFESVGGALESLPRHGARVAPPKWRLGPFYFSSERVPGPKPGPSSGFFSFFTRGLTVLWFES